MKVRNHRHFNLLIFSFSNSLFSLSIISCTKSVIYIRQNEIILAGSLLVRNWLSRTGYVIWLLMLFICSCFIFPLIVCSVYNEASQWSISQQNCVSLTSLHWYHLCMQSPPLKHMTKLIFPLSLYINPSICSEKVSEGLLCCGVLLQNMHSSD